jgi:hypothetical protein
MSLAASAATATDFTSEGGDLSAAFFDVPPPTAGHRDGLGSRLRPFTRFAERNGAGDRDIVTHYQSLCAMPEYELTSLEELRWDDTQHAGVAGLSSSDVHFVSPGPTRDVALKSLFDNLRPALWQLQRDFLDTVQTSVGGLMDDCETRFRREAKLTAELTRQLDQADDVHTMQQRYLSALEAEEKRDAGTPATLTIAQLESAVSRLQAVIQNMRLRQREETASKWSCKICYNAEMCVQFLPCLHVVCCTACALSVDKCPLCRADIAFRTTLMMG